MVKKSFTLFEVLVSLVVLAVVFTIVLKLFVCNDDIDTYYELQSIENQYNESATIKQSEKIKIESN